MGIKYHSAATQYGILSLNIVVSEAKLWAETVVHQYFLCFDFSRSFRVFLQPEGLQTDLSCIPILQCMMVQGQRCRCCLWVRLTAFFFHLYLCIAVTGKYFKKQSLAHIQSADDEWCWLMQRRLRDQRWRRPDYISTFYLHKLKFFQIPWIVQCCYMHCRKSNMHIPFNLSSRYIYVYQIPKYGTQQMHNSDLSK